MLSMYTNEIIIDKHSSSIQISNKISALQRKNYNYMLKILYPNSKDLRKRVIDVAVEEINRSKIIAFTISYKFSIKGKK